MARPPLETTRLSTLIEHIVTVFNRPLRAALPDLERRLRACESRRADMSALPLDHVARLVRSLRDELGSHVVKEERVLFPLILRGDGGRTEGLMWLMDKEHTSALHLLDQLGEATDGYLRQVGAPPEWAQLLADLEEIDLDTREHIRLERVVLFPRAITGEAP